MKKKILLILTIALLASSCSFNSFDKLDANKENSFESLNELLSVNYLPGIYDTSLDLNFKYDDEKYDLYYSFDSNYRDQISHYFKYEYEGIKIYQDEIKDKVNYPCTTSVDGKLVYDTEGKCFSSNYVNNIQNTSNYVFKKKLNTLNVILKDKTTNEEKLNKTYTYLVESGAKEKYKIPIVSINLPYEDMFDSLDGFYNNIRDDLSTRCSFEVIDPLYNEYTNLNSSIKLGGNWTLGYPLRTLNMNFNKDEFGKKNTPVTNHLFKDRKAISTNKELTKFTRLRIHSGGNAFEESIGFNDALLQSIMEGSKASTAASRPVISYINGEYWGLTYLREHYKTAYIEQNYGIKKDNVVTYDLKGSLIYDDGDEEEIANNKLNVMNDYINNKDFSNNAIYNEFINYIIDVDSFIDVVLAHAFCSNWDFIGNSNNLKAWASTTINESNPYEDGKIRFCIHDSDFAFRETTNVLNKDYQYYYAKFPLLNNLMKNENFKIRLLNRCEELYLANFKYENCMNKMDNFLNDIKDFKVESQIRWGAPSNYESLWNNELNTVRNNIKYKSSVFLSEVTNFINNY